MAVNKVQRKNGEIVLDVTGVTAAAADVAAGKKFVNSAGELVDGTMPSVTQATPSIKVSSGGLITASATQPAGKVAAGTKSATKQLTTQGAKTVTPTASEQVAVPAGVFTTGAVKVAGVSYDERAEIWEQLLGLKASDIYAAYGTLATFSGSTVAAHVSWWSTDAIYNDPVNYTNDMIKNVLVSAFNALDAYAASQGGGGTVVSGQIYASEKTLTISGLTFSKIKSIYFGIAGRAISNMSSSGYRIISGSIIDGMDKDSITYVNSGTVYTSTNSTKWFSYSYNNGTLTVSSSMMSFADYFNYYIVGV